MFYIKAHKKFKMDLLKNSVVSGEVLKSFLGNPEFIAIIPGYSNDLKEDTINHKELKIQHTWASGGIEFMPNDLEIFMKKIHRSAIVKQYCYVDVLDDTQVFVDTDSILKGDTLCLSKFHKIEDMPIWQDETQHEALIKESYECLKYIKNPSIDVCKIAIDGSSLALKQIQNPTKEIFEYAIKKHPYCFNSIKDPSYELCKLAMEANPINSFYYVPVKHRTYELCLIGVTNKGQLLKQVPSQHIDYDMCLAAVKSDGLILEFVPEKFYTEELCLAAISSNGYVLKFIEPNCITYSMCLIAVKSNGYAIKFCPEKFKNEELCLATVTQKGSVLNELPIITMEMVKAAVPTFERAIKLVDNPTEDECMKAVSKNGNILEYINSEYVTDKVAELAIKNSPYSIQYIKHPSEKLQLMAVDKTPNSVTYIKNACPEVFLHAIKKLPYLINQLHGVDDLIFSHACLVNPKVLDYMQYKPEKKKFVEDLFDSILNYN